jgi:hypothetical protein
MMITDSPELDSARYPISTNRDKNKFPNNIKELTKDAHIKQKSARVKKMISSVQVENIKQMK